MSAKKFGGSPQGDILIVIDIVRSETVDPVKVLTQVER